MQSFKKNLSKTNKICPDFAFIKLTLLQWATSGQGGHIMYLYYDEKRDLQ